MKSIFFILFLILSFSKASASQWNCWEEIDVTVCRHLQTGQIIRKSILSSSKETNSNKKKTISN